jgi:hypothetical protein
MVKVRYEGYVMVNPLVEGRRDQREVESERSWSQNAAMGNVEDAVRSYLKMNPKGALSIARR